MLEKKIEFLFLHEIVSKVKKHKIPSELIINIDQTPLKYVPVGNSTLAPRGEASVHETCLNTGKRNLVLL